MQIQFDAIGTRWEIDVYEKNRTVSDDDIQSSVLYCIEIYDREFSRFRADSLISCIAQKPGEYEFKSESVPLIALYKKMYDLTGGRFTPLIGQVLVDAGYDSTYSLKSKKLHSPKKWGEVLQFDPPRLKVSEPVVLDFGAAGKGFIVDRVGEVLERKGITSYSIDAGGDILCTNPDQPLRIGLENPQNTDEVIGVIEIRSGSICASAGNRRKWGKFHHIIHPLTLRSPMEILSVWVLSDNAMTADAIATALFLVGPEQLEPHFSFDYLILASDFTIKKSEAFDAEIFYNK